jgi:hypothetical protein
MSKFKFINIVDIIFISIATFLILFAWVQFFVKNLITSLMLSTLLTIAILTIFRWLKIKKYNNLQFDINRKQDLASFRLAVQTMPTNKLATLIKKLLPIEYLAKIEKGDIIFIKDNVKNIFTFHYSSELTETQLLNIIKTKNTPKLTIFCTSYTGEVKLIANAFKNIQVELVDIEELFEIFNKNNIKIDTSHIDLNKPKVTLKQIFKNSISRNKSKPYFISGLILLLTSLIIPYKIYYVIFSSILLILSLVCRFKPTVKTNYSIFH